MSATTSILTDCVQAKEREGRGDFEGAWSFVAHHLNIADELPPLDQANVLVRAGLIAVRTGLADREVAKDWLSRSLNIFEKENERGGAVEAYFGLALCCRSVGAFSEAFIWLDSAKDKVSDTDADMLGRIELLRGIVKDEEGKSREALEVYREVSPLFEALSDHNLKAKYHGELAIVYRKLATAEQSPELFDSALLEYTAASYHHEQAGDLRSAAIVKNNTAFLLFKLGRFGDGLAEANDAISIYQEVKDRPNLAQARETKAQILSALDRHQEAEAEARTSCELLRIGGERALLVESLVTHGRCYARLGQKTKAFQAFQQAQEVAEFIEFGQGLGLISLAILEEFNDLDIDTRRSHHRIVKERLAVERDAELASRHTACVRITAEMFKAEMGLDEIQVSHFGEGFSLDKTVLAYERLLIEQALKEASGCQKEAARLLGISPSNLNFKLKHQHKDAKRLQTYGHYRGAKSLSHIATRTMPNEALLELGINEGDELALKAGCQINVGDVVVVKSRRKLYIGIYQQERGTIILSPANADYETLYFDERGCEIAWKVVGYIPRDEVGTSGAKIRELPNDASAARLPAS